MRPSLSVAALFVVCATASPVGALQVTQTIAVPPGPAFLAVTPDGTKAYLTNRDANALTVLGLAGTPHAVGSLAVGTAPHEVRITSDGQYAFVGNSASGTVTRVDVATDSVGATYSVCGGSKNLALSPDDQHAYVVCDSFSERRVVKLALDDGAVSAFYADPPWVPMAIDLSGDGRYAYIGLQDSFAIKTAIVDTQTDSLVAEISGLVPGVASHDGARLWLRDFFSNQVALLDVHVPSSPVLQWTSPVPQRPNVMVLSPDESRLYLTCDFDGFLQDLDAASGATLDSLRTSGTWPSGLALSVDGMQALVTNLNSDTVDVVDLERNFAPAVGEITGPAAPVPVGTTVSVSAAFLDPGTHTAVWTWGDGASSAGVVSESSGIGLVTGEHLYTAAGVYRVSLTVVDHQGSSGLSTFEFVVVYDPAAGFVTGGGWIASPAGAYGPDPSAAGKATFGFVSRYHNGATLPTGQTEFQFRAGGLSFCSTSYDWLVVSGAKARYAGTGSVNGTGSYRFRLTAADADVNTNDNLTTDRFRLRIWADENGGERVVYDNGLGADELDSDPRTGTTELGGGSIVIHRD